jgi:hypothetical protein
MKKRYPEHEESVDYFVEGDPSGNNKYLQWMMKQHAKNGQDMGVVLSVATRFHQNVQRLQKKDINQYKTVDELVDAVVKIGKSKGEQEREIKREGADTIYEDENVVVIKPLNHKASCKYGSGTQWCVTMKSTDAYWNNYTKKSSHFGGTNWYRDTTWVEEELERTWLQKLLGLPPKTIKKEVKGFIEEFPVGILYFVLYKRRIKEETWNDELKAYIPKYVKANQKYRFNKLALLYQPDRADFGDMNWSKDFRRGNPISMISDKLDSAHNNMSIFNAVDEKVDLKEVHEDLGKQFSVPFAHIENDFQKERDAMLGVLSNVLDQVLPLMGAEGSKKPKAWVRGGGKVLQSVDPKNIKKSKGGGIEWHNSRKYKGGHW